MRAWQPQVVNIILSHHDFEAFPGARVLDRLHRIQATEVDLQLIAQAEPNPRGELEYDR